MRKRQIQDFYVCTRCKQAVARTDFYTIKATGLPHSSCKSCHKKAARASDLRLSVSYEVKRKYYHKSNYGLEHGGYEKLLKAQDFKCAICGSPNSGRKNSQHFHIDHCHATGKIRGLLCHHCNMGLGAFRDDPDKLGAAAKYLLSQ